MKLFTSAIDKQLFAQYNMGNDLENQKVVAKIFNPYGAGTWYLLNSDPNDPDYIWAIVDLIDIEMGSVSRSELESIKVPPFRLPLERDTSFSPINALELYRGLKQGKRYADGGTTDFKPDVEIVENKLGKNYLFPKGSNPDTMGIEFAKGGNIKSFKKDEAYRLTPYNSIERSIMERVPNEKEYKLAGNFYIKGHNNDAYIYFLDEFDRDYVKKVDIKPNERIYRYITRNSAIGGMMPLIKINVENGLVYYPIFENEDVLVGFDKRGQKTEYLNLIEADESDYYANGGYMAKGGKINLGDVVEVKEPNYGYDDSYYVVDNKAGYDKNGFLISATRKRVGDVFEKEQLRKLYANGGSTDASEDYIISDGSGMYYSRSLTNGNVKWNDSQDMAYMFSKGEAESIKSKLETEGYSNLSVQKYDKEWWKKMAMGGETEEGVDLFEDYDDIPENVQKVLDKHSAAFEDGDYRDLEKAHKDLQKIGYTFEYGLDGQAYDLRKIGQKGKSEEYGKGGYMADGGMMAKGGMVVTSIKDIPNFKQRLEERKITYRGLGMGKKSDDFYDLAGENGKSIKVDGKEYYITDTEFDSFSRGSDGKLIVRFDAPYKKSYADGGYMANGGIIGGLTADEAIYLYVKRALVQKYREKYLKPAGLWNTPKSKDVEQSLIKKGFLNNAGAITESGKNKAKDVDSEIGQMISRGYIQGYNLISKYKEIVEKFDSVDKMAMGGMMADGGYMEKGGEIIVTSIKDIPNFDKRLKEGKITYRGIGLGKFYDRFFRKYKTDGYRIKVDEKEYLIDYWDYSRIEKLRDEDGNILVKFYDPSKMAMGGEVKFADKVKSIKSSLLKRKKVSPSVQKDYGKTYSPKEAEESAKRIVGAMMKKRQMK